MSEQKGNKQMTRREFIRKGSYVAGGVIGGGVLGGLITQQVLKPNQNNQGAAPPENGEVERFTRYDVFFKS